MGSAFDVNVTDLDAIFAPWVTGWPKASATGYLADNVDLNQRYAPLATGEAAALTGYKVAGVDLNAIFAAKGSTGVIVGEQPENVSGSAAAGFPAGNVTSSSATCAGAKGKGSYTYTWHVTSGGATPTAPNSATTDFDYDVPAGTTVSGEAYCTISDGATSVNTTSITYGLQNTTPAYLYNGTLTADGYVASEDYVGIGYNTDAAIFPEDIGTLSPTMDINGNTIRSVLDINSGGSIFAYLAIFSDTELGQDYFGTVVSNGQTFESSSSDYSYSGGVNVWGFQGGSFGFTETEEYNVEIFP